MIVLASRMREHAGSRSFGSVVLVRTNPFANANGSLVHAGSHSFDSVVHVRTNPFANANGSPI